MARPRKPFRLIKPGQYYYVAYHDGQRSQRASTGTQSRAEAERFLDRFVAGYEDAAPGTVDIRSVLDGYAAARPERSRRGNRKYLIKNLNGVLGNLNVGDITDAVVKRYAKQRGKANGTILRELGILRAATYWAERQQWIERAPRFQMPVPNDPPKDRWLTKEEGRRLLDAATAPHIRMFIMLGLYTGARTGAMLDLEWSRVGRLINYGDGVGNKRRAIVPIAEPLRVELDAQREVATTGHVIEYNGRPITRIGPGWSTVVRRAGLERVTPHTLRHTCATWMIQEGVSLRKVARMLGDTEATVERVYGHHAPEWLSDAVEALEF